MKLSRRVIVVLFVILVLLTGVSLYFQYSSSQNTGPWAQTTSYPLQAGGMTGVFGQSCVTGGTDVYCIGGQDANGDPTNSTYVAPLSSSGFGTWNATTPYPRAIMFESCVTSTGYVYCTAGTMDSVGDDVNSSYYAPINSGTLGNWTQTTSFPTDADSLACVSSSGYIYCTGGENETSGTNSTATTSSSFWYAPLTSGGIGTWASGPSYPSGSFFPECTTVGGYMYCVGGEDSSGDPISSTYYSYLTPGGAGAWTSSTAYPVEAVAIACTTSSTVVYCIDGLQPGGATVQSVYYAGVTPSGIGTWQTAAQYPEGLSTDCVSQAGYIYCVGGFNAGTNTPTGDDYYAPLAVNSTTSSSSS